MRETMFIWFLIRNLKEYGLKQGIKHNIFLIKTWGLKTLLFDQLIGFLLYVLNCYFIKQWDNQNQKWYNDSLVLFKFITIHLKPLKKRD
jgi:hypothetical protein